MKTEIFKRVDGSTEIQMVWGPAEVELLSHNVVNAAIGAASQALADQFIKEKGPALIAAIPLESVLNQAIAETVVRIAAAATRRP